MRKKGKETKERGERYLPWRDEGLCHNRQEFPKTKNYLDYPFGPSFISLMSAFAISPA